MMSLPLKSKLILCFLLIKIQRVRLAQITNKCTNEDLDYFVKECGDILGVSDKVTNKSNAKAIIKHVLEQLVNFKKLNQG